MCGKWEVDLRSNLFDPISNQLPFSDFVGDKGFVVVVFFFLTFRVRQAFKWNTLAKKKKKIKFLYFEKNEISYDFKSFPDSFYDVTTADPNQANQLASSSKKK
jgi:hypothetical protein